MEIKKGLNITEQKQKENTREGHPTLSGSTVNNPFISQEDRDTLNEFMNDNEPYQRAMNVIMMYANGIKR